MQCKLKSKWSFNEKPEGSSLRGGVSQKIIKGLNIAGQLKKRYIQGRPEMLQGMAINNQWPWEDG